MKKEFPFEKLSVRTRNALICAGFEDLDQVRRELEEKGGANFLQIPNFGKKALAEVYRVTGAKRPIQEHVTITEKRYRHALKQMRWASDVVIRYLEQEGKP